MTNRFKKLEDDYFNAGGHHMVYITAVYDKQEKRMLYVGIDDEDLVVATVDYIRQETDLSPEDYIKYEVAVNDYTTNPTFDNFSMIDLPDDIVDLLMACWLQYIRTVVKYSGKYFECSIDQLPNDLFNQLTADYIKWLDGSDSVRTDGYVIIYEDAYLSTKEPEDSYNAKTAKQLHKDLDAMMPVSDAEESAWQVFYDHKFQLIINDKLYTFENSAAVYNSFYTLAKDIIEEEEA